MKKLSVLLVAAAVAVSASAGVNFKANHAVKSNKMVNTEMTKFKAKDLKAKASLRVITDQPAGELKTYDRAGQAVYISGNSIYAGEQTGSRMDIVYGEEGKVYMKNIIFGIGNYFGDSWVEGTIEGNEIHVPMGQSIYWSEDYQADVVLAMGTTAVEGTSITFTADDRATEAVYVIDGNTISLQGTSAQPTGSEYPAYEGYGLSCYWTDDNTFGGFNEWNTVLTEHIAVPAPELITEIPDGCQVYTYFRNSGYIANSFFGIMNGTTDGKLTIAFDAQNGEVYIQNPMWWHDSYNTWVKGTYTYGEDGVYITIPTGQYLSWNDEQEYGIQLVWGSTYVYQEGEDEEGNPAYYMGFAIDDRTTEINFMLGDDCIYLLGTEGDINAEFPEWGNTTGMMTIYSDDQSMTAIEIANRDEYGYAEPIGYMVDLVPAVPANPTADDWYDCGNEGGFSRFYFTLPTTDVNGKMIDPEHISYSVYVDNGNGPELFTFDAATYSYDLTEDITEVPFSVYNSAMDFRNYFVYFYRTNAEGFTPLFTDNIGIQAHYTVDGVKNSSEIVWLYETHVAVDEVNAGKTVANVRYFNVAGQEMAQPEGMTIQVTTYTDGTKSAVKVVK